MKLKVRETKGYQLKLPLFEGPLDLLLQLVEQNQLPITEISLAQVTDQYLTYLHQSAIIQLNLLADFLEVGAKLLLIKSRALLPQAQSVVEEDVASDLTQQLFEYKLFKEKANLLRLIEERSYKSFPRLRKTQDNRRQTPLEGLSLNCLVDALRGRLSLLEKDGEPIQKIETIKLVDKVTFIRGRLMERESLFFHELLDGAASKVEVVITFMAILELWKRGVIIVFQEVIFGPILIERAETLN